MTSSMNEDELFQSKSMFFTSIILRFSPTFTAHFCDSDGSTTSSYKKTNPKILFFE